ncbi:MAG TPA: Wzy polymerase domain-containing protein [Caldimonas sp.]
MVAIGLVAPWWLPVLATTIPTFYKEWLFVLALGFAGLIAKPLASPIAVRERPNPLVLAALAAIVILLLQIVLFEGVWRKATLMIFCLALFVFAIVLGQRMHTQSDNSLAWIAKCLLVAAVGSCLLAAAQLFLPGLPFVLPRAGPRLYANVAQSNHFADLLWIGCVSVAVLYAGRVLGWKTALGLIIAILTCSTTSGSRMAWIYAAGLGLLGAACWLRTSDPWARRLARALVAVALAYVAVTTLVAMSGILESFGLTSAEQRVAGGESAESNAQRLWFWHVGLSAAVDHPLLGVGAGRFAGEGLASAMRVSSAPRAAADAQAHNAFVQLAAECGIPLALAAIVALLVWLARAWRGASRWPETFAAIALALPILIHANLEHPLGYLYFLGLLGLLVGHVHGTVVANADPVEGTVPAEALRWASFAVLAVAAFCYVQFVQVERATQALAAQMRAGVPPQPTSELEARLSKVPRWSVFGDYAELVALIAAVPTAADATELASRCERSIAFGPSPPLLARCATILQVAGQSERASYFANALCKIYPEAVPTLIESMTLVDRTNPAVEDLRSTCVQRAK